MNHFIECSYIRAKCAKVLTEDESKQWKKDDMNTLSSRLFILGRRWSDFKKVVVRFIRGGLV